MSRYPLKLPVDLKLEAEERAASQGVSLNQFIVWSVAEKVGALRQSLDDPNFPMVTLRRGAAQWPRAVIRGTGVHVRTVVVARDRWAMPVAEIAEEWGLTIAQVEQALAFYAAHRTEIDAQIALEETLEAEPVR
ncbi:MAG: DUF433 domain-containing protein [Acidobacteriota bacterium]